MKRRQLYDQKQGLRLTAQQRERVADLYTRHMRLMVHIASGLVRQEEVEDVIGESVLRLAEHLPQLDKLCEAQERAYIARTTQNTALDLLRRKKYRAQMDGPPLDALGIELADEGAEEAFRMVEELSALDAAIAQLPPSEREAIELRYMHGMNDKEAAAVMEMQEASFRACVSRASRHLQQIKRQG